MPNDLDQIGVFLRHPSFIFFRIGVNRDIFSPILIVKLKWYQNLCSSSYTCQLIYSRDAMLKLLKHAHPLSSRSHTLVMIIIINHYYGEDDETAKPNYYHFQRFSLWIQVNLFLWTYNFFTNGLTSIWSQIGLVFEYRKHTLRSWSSTDQWFLPSPSE